MIALNGILVGWIIGLYILRHFKLKELHEERNYMQLQRDETRVSLNEARDGFSYWKARARSAEEKLDRIANLATPTAKERTQ